MPIIQMNIGDHSGSENGQSFTPFLSRQRWQVNWGRRKAAWIARNIPSANRFFRSLSGGRSLTSMIHDSSLWLNYDASIGYYGYTYANSDIWIGPLPFRWGKWTVCATIIHELAHINGAPGGSACSSTCSAACRQAERAVLESGLGNPSERRSGVDDPATPYDPTICG